MKIRCYKSISVKLRCYKNDEGDWAAHMVDSKTDEQIGPEVVTDDPDTSVFQLGVMYGAHQNRFARPLDMIIPVEH
ncbi:MAG: hypothetical protein EBR82_74485 [Caulobacteraceae bacterium]|nr:hypothetical protein [Caulobacteraceae bacterium]